MVENPRSVTQARHPWRATLRTVAAVAGALLLLVPLVPEIVDQSGLSRYAWAGGVVAVAAAVTRVLAIPGVNAWLTRHVPPLAAAPKAEDRSSYSG